MTRCPFPSCHADVAPSQLACRTHWKLVPAGHQTAVWNAWRARQAARKVWEASRSKVDLAALGRASKGHRGACRAAIAAAAELASP